MGDREDFYLERDQRTREYLGQEDAYLEQPVVLRIGDDAADSPVGQLTAMATMNMVARVHRRVFLICPKVPLLAPRAMLGAECGDHATLSEAMESMAHAIDPFLHLQLRAPMGSLPGVAVGAGGPGVIPWHVGTDGGLVRLAPASSPIVAGDGFSLGAPLAACIASAALFKQVVGKPVLPLEVSAWSLTQGPEAARGPENLGPVDVGDVAMIGAGGVGSALAYWLRQSGIRGTWQVVDRDSVKLHNTNRSLGMVPADAGWPDGQCRPKAVVAGDLFGAAPIERWFDGLDHEHFRPDLILPLANERGVRALISQRGEPVLLHATTSLTWEAQLHRHIAGRDDCITCRMPVKEEGVKLECSVVPLHGSGSRSTDAALPFLSGTAGFLLMNGLYRLMSGDLAQGDRNLWRVLFNSSNGIVRSGRCSCQIGCAGILGEGVRRRINSGRRWGSLDLACSSHIGKAGI